MRRKVWVQICEVNPCGEQRWLQVLAALNGKIRVERVVCLDHCTFCRNHPFALVNGRMLGGSNAAEVMQQIVQEVAANKADQRRWRTAVRPEGG